MSFLFDSVESSKYCKAFSGSLIDTPLPNCLLFHFSLLKWHKVFCFCCFPKQTVLLHYPSICACTRMTAHASNSKDHRPWAGSGSRHWEGWGQGAQWPASWPRSSSFPSTHTWRYLRDPLASSADASLPIPWIACAMKLVEAPAFGYKKFLCSLIYPSRNYGLKPTSLTHATELCSTEPKSRYGSHLSSAHGPFPASYISNFSLSLPLSNKNGV